MKLDELIKNLQKMRKKYPGNILVRATWEGITTDIRTIYFSKAGDMTVHDAILMDVDQD